MLEVEGRGLKFNILFAFSMKPICPNYRFPLSVNFPFFISGSDHMGVSGFISIHSCDRELHDFMKLLF